MPQKGSPAKRTGHTLRVAAQYSQKSPQNNGLFDRREAIARAIHEASDDDVIVIAGKGHESYQVVGDQVIHFDDREEAELVLKKRHEKTA